MALYKYFILLISMCFWANQLHWEDVLCDGLVCRLSATTITTAQQLGVAPSGERLQRKGRHGV